MRFMKTESVLQTKNRSGPAKNRFSVALLMTIPFIALLYFKLYYFSLSFKVIDWRLKPEILAQGGLNVNERHHGYY